MDSGTLVDPHETLQPPNPKPPKEHPIWIETLLCLSFICFIAFATVFYYAKASMADIRGNFSGMFKSWESDMIFDIVNTTQNHGNSSTYVEPWQGYFPGTIDGCICEHTSLVFRARLGFKSRSCNYTEVWAGCIDIPSQPAAPLTKWIDGKELFVVRYRNTSFMKTFDKMNLDGTCKEGFKHCGNSQSKSKGACIPQDIPSCPITSISETQVPGFKEVNFGHYNLWYGVEVNGKNPICDVNITESHLCMARQELPTTPNRPRYRLLQGSYQNCQKDLQADAIQSMGERDLFDLNHINYRVLLRYDVDNRYQYHLMAGRRVEWSPDCFDSVPKMIQGEDRADKLYFQYQVLFVLLCIGILPILVLYVAMGIISYSDVQKKVGWWLFFAFLLIYTMLIPSAFIIYLRSNQLADELKNVVALNCSNDLTQNSFTELQNMYTEKVLMKNAWWFPLSLVGLFLGLMGAIKVPFWIAASKRENQAESQLYH